MESRAEALSRLDMFVGEWTVTAEFPAAPSTEDSGPTVRSWGVVRLYAMSLAERVWTLTRESADFTPLDFGQRFTGTVSEDSNTISGAWEKRFDGEPWEHDFTLTYRRVGRA